MIARARPTYPFHVGQAVRELGRLDEGREPLPFVPVARPVAANLPEADYYAWYFRAFGHIEKDLLCYPLGFRVARTERGGRVKGNFRDRRCNGTI